MDRFPKRNLSAFLNFLRAKYEAYTGAPVVASRPYYALIDPCDVCQLRCPTCPTGIENEGRRTRSLLDTSYRTDRGLMTPAAFDAIFEPMAEHLFLLELHSWGEPLLNKHLTTLARRARTFDVEVHMHTNLSLELTDDRVEDLVTCGLDCVFASIDGFSQGAYEKFRVGGDVELAKSNLRRLAETRTRLGSNCELVYKFLVFRWNEDEVPVARRFAEDIGATFTAQDACVTDATWLPSHRANELPTLTKEDILALERRWTEVGRGGYWREHEKRPVYLPVGDAHRWIPTGRDHGSFCGWHYSTVVIQPRGHVVPCCFAAKSEDRFGKLAPGEAGAADIWNGEHYRRARMAFATGSAEGPPETDNLCLRCHLPEPLRHVFSHNDAKVIGQFQHEFGERLPALARAFQILSLGETAETRARFVDYFDESLRN